MDNVEYEIRVEEEIESIDFDDKALEDEIREKAKQNVWAWCTIMVMAKYKGFVGADTLGCCSYDNEDDFMVGGYYEGMKVAALDDLKHRMNDWIELGKKAEQCLKEIQ